MGLIALTGFWLESERSRILAEKKQQAVDLMDVAYSSIARHHQMELAGQIGREEAQQRAMTVLRSMRYGGQNYFWIMSLELRMVMHPVHTDLEGKRLTDQFFYAMLRAVRRHGSGFVEYQWDKPGQAGGRQVTKISFVRGFAPWGWVVGTGLYLDDVEAAWRRSAARAIAVTLVCVLILLAVSITTFRSIFLRLSSMVERMKAVVLCHGDYSGLADPALRGGERSRQPDRDEVGVMVSGFSEMLQEIQKRDRELTQHGEQLERQVAARTLELSAAHASLERTYADLELFLESVPSILIGLDQQGRIIRWNAAAAEVLGIAADHAIGLPLIDCGIAWRNPEMRAEIASWLAAGQPKRCNDVAYERDGMMRFLGLSVKPIVAGEGHTDGLLITGADVTERKCLEEQLRQAHKLEAIGQLAAGVAHEINTPTQYVTDNTRFVKDSWTSIVGLLALCRSLREEAAQRGAVSVPALARFEMAVDACELDYLEKEVPSAIDQSLEGLDRVAKIVRAMKEFAHPGANERQFVDLNKAIESTVVLARGEWKYVAEVSTDLDPVLPLVPCFGGEFNETILNLIVNAAHAIAEVVGNSGDKGSITITTRRDGDFVLISIRDTGCGIPKEIRPRVFEPFFTTKPVGKGSGQGLALAHALVVKKHRGRIWFETDGF